MFITDMTFFILISYKMIFFPFSKYAFLTTHKSLAISGGHRYEFFSFAIANQEDKITQQLIVRLLNLIIVYLKINNLLI